MTRDEMVDGRGGLRPQWRNLLGVLAGLGRGVLAERARRLERVMEEEGAASLLPGSPPDPWRFDPIPLPLSQSEFIALEAGLAQRARLFDAVLADLYGPQRLLADGAVPAALVFANPTFLRPCRHNAAADGEFLQFYAADLARAPDGTWHVLADRTGLADGLAHALQNRRRLGRVVPELFVSQLLCHIDPFVELCLDMLRRIVPTGTAALLTPGHADPAWYGHVLLARELSCTLVEGGDLTVRDGGLFLKTLRGLQPISVLLRGVAGSLIDPLELDADGAGVPGLLAAARDHVQIVNSPGSSLAEAPALAAFLSDLATRLLGENLALPSVPTVWLGDSVARASMLAGTDAWCLRPAFDSALPPVPLAAMAERQRRALLDRMETAPWRFAASAVVTPSLAPCLDGEGLEPRPVLVRMFLVRDRGGWRAMPGGLGCVLPDGAQAWPSAGPVLAKDVWVLAENPAAIEGPSSTRTPPLAIRRTAGDMPSRVADNYFWLGRYLERLEGAARLLRITIGRLSRPAPTPHEMAELDVLIACLTQAGLLNAEAIAGLGPVGLGQALLRVAGSWGSIHALLGQVSRVTGLLRAQVTGEMHAVTARGLREVEDALGRIPAGGDGQALDVTFEAMSRVLAFAATLSGLAAENMVRGGGRLFLDLGRRVERAQAVADQLACALEFPGVAQQPARIEHGLRLALELCDSSITYRSRYLSVLQPAPALDLLLADDGNPRGLAFQLAAMRVLLSQIGSGADTSLAAAAAALQDEPQAMVRSVTEAADQSVAALFLPARLRSLRDAIAELSDRVSRRYFALLPTARTVGIEAPPRSMRGAA
ncbi:MAG TPA: circularly permuted type 2 ATP-grasp protein [Acetobacteraceae bacterium]|nr:circularly permuted type 2 ATP-grasp protein [Acetobacteraceae bacterium]